MVGHRLIVVAVLLTLLIPAGSITAQTPPVLTEISTDTTLSAGTYTYGTLVVKTGATLFLEGNSQSSSAFKGVRIEADSIVIEAGGAINADRQGYDGVTRGPGSPSPNDYQTGASYGGIGFGANPAATYGSARRPADLGSFGLHRGGGAVELIAQNEIRIDGSITADGAPTGSGGSIYIQANSFTGGGTITADGGPFEAQAVFIGPGGGGRIAAHYNSTNFTGATQARGGSWPGFGSAEAGTVGFFDENDNTLTTGPSWRFEATDAPHNYTAVHANDSSIKTSPDQDLTFGTLELTGSSNFLVESGHHLTAQTATLSDTSALRLEAGAPLDIQQLNILDSASIVADPLATLAINATDIALDAGTKISASESGYAPLLGPGSPDIADVTTGASYGGQGYGPNAKPTYGSDIEPTDFGSGANRYRGGGALALNVSDTLTNNGSIESNGGGSSSGGSVKIQSKVLAGIGRITANGGDFTTTAEFVGPGGGGRIAVYYEDINGWVGQFDYKGGQTQSSAGDQIGHAGNGTLVLQQKTLCTENCNSNVLFLPGIMGSRLYETSSACGFINGEKERWFSIFTCDQLRLLSDAEGKSINDIYTKEGSVIDETLGLNLYKTFLADLEQWKQEGVFFDYAAVPYDWRMDLDNIITAKKASSSSEIRLNPGGSYSDGYLYQKFQALVKSSKSGKVTIVAHSNGGLVAKYFLKTLRDNNDPLADQVDNLILVAVPQVGTPDDVTGILHGTALGYGTVVYQETARKLTNTAPFAYHLLPNENYFRGTGVRVTTPVITFEDGAITTPMKDAFGAFITTADALYHFLGSQSGRSRPADNDLLTPALAQDALLNYAKETAHSQNEWESSSSTKIYQIAGVGVSTPAGITYFTDRKCIGGSQYGCPIYEPKLGYRINETIDGDETVVSPSALALNEAPGRISRLWVNLFEYNNAHNVNTRTHKNIMEISDVTSFIKNTLEKRDQSSYTYLETSAPSIPNEERLVFQLHSPLDMKIIGVNGTEVSSTSNSIPGSVYSRFGELQYISLPNTPNQKTLVLTGQASGSFTLDVEKYTGNSFISRQTYSAIPSATSTKVELAFSDASSTIGAVLAVDFNGDNHTDSYYDTGGIVMMYSYENLFDTLYALAAPQKQSLIALATTAKRQHSQIVFDSRNKELELNSLASLKRQFILYVEKRFITPDESTKLLKIIEYLISL